ncbi:MAG: ABC transporter ATP-binding protein [Desulfosoma sp.]|uniref:ABC transporter ATP-binding protein n=1 Tax=Desulfosoma sp. TaxID=2603217 RepID=UPI00404A16E2
MLSLQIESLSIKSPGLPEAIVEGVAFEVPRGGSVGIVGESGAGKTLTALAVCGLVPEPLKCSGTMRLDGREIDLGERKAFKDLRGRGVFMIFQSATMALDPTMRTSDQVCEALVRVKRLSRRAALHRTRELLSMVGLGNDIDNAWPFQLSGGMRQRVQIAIAMALEPSVLIADEPTTGLDPFIQIQILGLLDDLRKSLGTSLVIISHDLRVIARMTDFVWVMQKGRMVESGPVAEIFQAPRSPYTKRMIESVRNQEEMWNDHSSP